MVCFDGDWVVFRFFRVQARQVHLVGDFNGWHQSTLPMARTPDGYWMARLRLPVGEFRFRYRADGEWFTDYAAFGIEQGPFGMDSIVRVTLGGEGLVSQPRQPRPQPPTGRMTLPPPPVPPENDVGARKARLHAA